MSKGRLEAFSDGVIAIIITIMVLELRAPHESSLEALRPLVPKVSTYLMSFIFVGGKPIVNRTNRFPAKTEVSDVLSKDLGKRGFKFVGSTICYAHMQATGMVNDHVTSCFRYGQLAGVDRG